MHHDRREDTDPPIESTSTADTPASLAARVGPPTGTPFDATSPPRDNAAPTDAAASPDHAGALPPVPAPALPPRSPSPAVAPHLAAQNLVRKLTIPQLANVFKRELTLGSRRLADPEPTPGRYAPRCL